MKRVKIYLIILMVFFLLLNVSFAMENNIDSENDPLITQSYLELRIQQIKAYFDEKLDLIIKDNEEIKEQISSVANEGNIFEVVTLKPGKKMLCGAGTEVILRAGGAKAIANEQGGIVDVTGGIDIQNDKDIPKQHLLIIPRDDGRGLAASAKVDTVLMVRGSYLVK